jgi:hypothetical protein
LYPSSISVAVCGDPVICRALVLLLRDPNYNVRFVPASSTAEPGSFVGVQVVLLALEPGIERRRAVLGTLQKAMDTARVSILELVVSYERNLKQPHNEAWLGHKVVPWPCGTDELKRHVQAALSNTLALGRARWPNELEGKAQPETLEAVRVRAWPETDPDDAHY